MCSSQARRVRDTSRVPSTGNVEIVRRALAAAVRRPKPDFATVNALYDPDHELVTPMSRLEGASLRGAQGFRTWLSGISGDWDSLEPRIDRLTEIDQDRVLVEWQFIAHSKRGGVPIEQRNGFVVTVRDGKVVRSENYSSPEEALAAVQVGE